MIPDVMIAYGAFLLVCAALLTLPFLPAIGEWRRPTDGGALPVAPDYSTNVHHFASRLRADALARLGKGAPTGHEDFAFVSSADDDEWKQGKRLIALGDMDFSRPVLSDQPLYVEGAIRVPAGSAFTALYATGDAELGDDSRITNWAHAGGVLRLGSGSAAVRRISADKAIELGSECWFERVHAPSIRFGLRSRDMTPFAPPAQQRGDYLDLPGAVQQTPNQYLVRGDCALPPGKHYQGALVVTGFLTIGAGTTVAGDVKAREGASIGPRASVHGALTCEKRVYALQDSSAWGPLVCETDLLVGARAVIGLPDAQTTVTARNIILEEGSVVHGEVWAHELGMVKAA